jgi:hypothetical protein
VLWQRLKTFWLDLCTKQVVSARACANQFLPRSSSGIALVGMRTVQADSCLNSEQIDTLFTSVGGQEGLGGGRSIGPAAQKMHMTVRNSLFAPSFLLRGMGQNGVSGQVLLRFAPLLFAMIFFIEM